MGRRPGRALAAVVLAVAPFPATVGVAAASGAPEASLARVPSGGCSRPYEDARVRCLVDATGAPEAWRVPAGVSFLSVDAWGGQGAAARAADEPGASGGRGGGLSRRPRRARR